MKCLFVLFAMFFVMCSFVSADSFSYVGMEESLSLSDYYEYMDGALVSSLYEADYFDAGSRFHLASTPVYAQDLGGGGSGDESESLPGRINDARKHIELMPMAGYTFGGTFDDNVNDDDLDIDESSSYGFRVAYDSVYDSHFAGYNTQIEFIYSKQETEVTSDGLFPDDALFDMDISYYHIGGTIFMNKNSKVEPYFNGSLGLTTFDPDESSADSLTRFSMGFGGGVRYFPIERLGLCLGARGLVTFVDSEFSSYSESGGAHVEIESDTLWQFQIYGGLVFVF